MAADSGPETLQTTLVAKDNVDRAGNGNPQAVAASLMTAPMSCRASRPRCAEAFEKARQGCCKTQL